MADSSTEDFAVPVRFYQDLENKIFDIELFYQVLVKIYVDLKNVKTTLLKADREKVVSGDCLLVKVRGPFKNIYKTINYIKALCGAGPAEVGLLYEPHLLPVWVAFQGFYLKWLEFDNCLPIVSLTDCGMTVRPVSENILDRFVSRLDELSSLCEQKSYNSASTRILTDSVQINQRFFDLLDRCAEPMDNRDKLMCLPDRAKDRLLILVKEAGAPFQPTLIRRLSWRENEDENKLKMAEFQNTRQIIPGAQNDIMNFEPSKRPLKRRFMAYNDPKNGLTNANKKNELSEQMSTGRLSSQRDLASCSSSDISSVNATMSRSCSSMSSFQSSRSARAQMSDLSLTSRMAMAGVPIARTTPASCFINSTSLQSYRNLKMKSSIEKKCETQPAVVKEESSEEIIVISDEDDDDAMDLGQDFATKECQTTSDYIEKEESSSNFPEPENLANWFRSTFLPSENDSDNIYKSDMLNYFLGCYSLENNKFISTSFYQFVKDFLDYDPDYTNVVQKGNTGIRSRKRYVHLKLAERLKPPFIYTVNTPTGTPSSTPQIKRKSEGFPSHELLPGLSHSRSSSYSSSISHIDRDKTPGLGYLSRRSSNLPDFDTISQNSFVVTPNSVKARNRSGTFPRSAINSAGSGSGFDNSGLADGLSGGAHGGSIIMTSNQDNISTTSSRRTSVTGASVFFEQNDIMLQEEPEEPAADADMTDNQENSSTASMDYLEAKPPYPRPETPNLLLQYKIQFTTVTDPKSKNFKPIIIDGSNVAMCHGNNRRYSCRGIAIIIEYFYKRGHREIIAFIPSYRKSKRIENLKPVTYERYLLDQLESHGYVAWTPSRWISGKGRVSAYDDRFIIKCAAEKNGVIISNDTFKDLLKEAERNNDLHTKSIIESNLLMFTFVGDSFMPPDDPLGRFGPRLDFFLTT